MSNDNKDAVSELKQLAEAATPGPWERDGRTVDEDGYVHIPECSYLVGLICLAGSYEGYQEDCDYIAAANPAAILDLIAANAAQVERIKQLEHEIWCAGVNADGAQEKSGERIATLEAALQHESASALAHERRHQELLHEKMQSADLQAAIMALTCELPAGYDDSRERLIYLQSHTTAVARAAALVASARPSAALTTSDYAPILNKFMMPADQGHLALCAEIHRLATHSKE